METIAAVLLAVAGVVNFVPVVGMRSARTLSTMYGITVRAGDGDLAILLRHRAVMLGLVGGFMIVAAFVPGLRTAASAIGLVSMVSFVAIARDTRSHNGAIAKVARIDVVLSLMLVAALVLRHSH